MHIWDQFTIGFVAGIVEGEGYISYSNGSPSVRVGMTDLDTIQKVQDLTGIGRITGPYVRSGNKPIWHWSVCNHKECARLLLAIAPVMCKRRMESIAVVTDLIREMVSAMASKLCRQCDEPFASVRPSAARRRIFCSKTCCSRWHRQNLANGVCMWCRESFSPRDARTKCCSKSCSQYLRYSYGRKEVA